MQIILIFILFLLILKIYKYKKEKEVIYVIPKQFNILLNIYLRKGIQLPGIYVTGNCKESKYIVNSQKYDIGKKTYQTYFKHLNFFPKTIFPGEKVIVNKNDIYFYKEHNIDNCKGVNVMLGKDLPKYVPKNIIIQKEIKPYLYKKLKFDIRVLCAVRRDGYIYFYKNIFYRFASKEYTGSISKIEQLSAIPYKLRNGIEINSFFEYDKKNIMNHKNYVKQLQQKLKEVYSSILPFANSAISGNLKNRFLIIGMDFIPDKNDNLFLIELNTVPGWNSKYGIHNYRKFYNEVTKFILGKNIDKKYGDILKI
jgi:hypothetical protein